MEGNLLLSKPTELNVNQSQPKKKKVAFSATSRLLFDPTTGSQPGQQTHKVSHQNKGFCFYFL